MRDGRTATLAALGAAVEASHLGRGAGFVDKDKLVWIKARGELTPGRAGGRHVGPVLLGGVHAFF